MEVLDYRWFIYKLKGYNENKSNFIPILVVDVDGKLANHSGWGEINISVKSPKKMPTYWGHFYEYNSIGNLEIFDNKYDNDYDDYFTIKSSNDSHGIYCKTIIHFKGDPKKYIDITEYNRTGELNKSFSLTCLPVFCHTADEYYISEIKIINTDVYSAPNDTRKGAIPGGTINIEMTPSFKWDVDRWKPYDA